MRTVLALGVLAGLVLPAASEAMSLSEAIAQAQRSNPSLGQVSAQADAATARLAQARAGRLPSLTLSGEAAEGRTDLGGFFGFGRSDVSPRAAALELRQPLFAGGAINAAVERASEGRKAAAVQVGGARALLAAQTAGAYVGVLTAEEIVALNQAQARQLAELVRQADLRFKGGEIARTDLAQAQARAAEAQAGMARARGDLARARAHFETVVGLSPENLEPLAAPPAMPSSRDEALAVADRSSPMLLSASAASRAADAALRYAQSERLPSLALTVKASTARDQFFPGYRSEDVTVGVQGRWTLFAGGAINGRVDEARAGLRAARFAQDDARAQVREAVIGAWEDVETSRALVTAASDQVNSAQSALDSVRNEVRVGQKPMLDLLNAEREALGAQSAMVAARGGVIVASYRLNALLQAE